MKKKISNWFKNFRFWLALKILMLSISVIDKSTLEGVSFITIVDEWVKFLEKLYRNQKSA